MSDAWDELLRQLPSDPPSPALLAQVQARLQAERRRRILEARIQSGVALAAASGGTWLLVPWLAGTDWPLPTLTLARIAGWLSGLAASPMGSALVSLAGLQAWTSRWSASMDLLATLALALLAVPACWGVLRLLADEGRNQGWAE
jgi:hypothetical protein